MFQTIMVRHEKLGRGYQNAGSGMVMEAGAAILTNYKGFFQINPERLNLPIGASIAFLLSIL